MRSLLQSAILAAFISIITAAEFKDDKPKNDFISFNVTLKDNTNASLLEEGGKDKLLDINIETLRKELDKLNPLILQQKNIDSSKRTLSPETRIDTRNDNEKQRLRESSLKIEGKIIKKKGIDNFEKEQAEKPKNRKDDEVQDKKQVSIPKDSNSNRSSKEHSSLSNQRKEMEMNNFMMNGV